MTQETESSPPLSIDDESTWPGEIRDVLDLRSDLLRAYEAEQGRIDDLCQADFNTRISPPVNRYLRERTAVLATVRDGLRGKDLIGLHCTRLHADEIMSIRAHGLRPLDPELLRLRLNARLLNGDLPGDVAARIAARNSANDNNRRNMLWFLFTRGGLRSASAVGRLLFLWGGEALYRLHVRDNEIASRLQNIGTPCIITAAVPIESVRLYSEASERLVASYLQHRGVETEFGPHCEGYVREAVSGERILRIVTPSDSEFAELTPARSAWL
jgi:hypothetical protein